MSKIVFLPPKMSLSMLKSMFSDVGMVWAYTFIKNINASRLLIGQLVLLRRMTSSSIKK